MSATSLENKRSANMLNGPWRFQLDQDDLGVDEGWFAVTFDHNVWGTAVVPRPWDFYDQALWGYEGVGWFATEIPGDWVQPERWQRLIFSRVNYEARVWLNGHFLGQHLGGYLPFEFAVSPHLRPDQPNRLVVRVDNTPRPTWLPGGQQIEWVQYGGILQPVRLVTTDPAYLTDVRIVATPEGLGAQVTITCQVANHRPQALSGRLVARVAVPDVPVTAETGLDCTPAGTGSAILSLVMPVAEKWSPDRPTLYPLIISLVDGEETVDAVSERFGVRTIAVHGQDILLNGEPLFVKGVNRYDEYAGFGPTVPAEVVRRDLSRIKQAGVNLIRVHYPHSAETLDLLDELGLLLLEEIPLNWWGLPWWGSVSEDDHPAIVDAAEAALTTMIERDKNHPCVLAWSMANESFTDTAIGSAAMHRLMRRARALDPTRPITFVAAGEIEGHEAFAEADFVAVNLYHGLFRGELAHHLADLETLVRQETAAHLRQMRAGLADKPLLITEFGTHGIKGLRGDARFTEDFQAAYIRAVWQAITDVPGLAGGVLWCWADYFHRRNFIGTGGRMIQSAYGPYGVVTIDRREKAALFELARLFDGPLTDNRQAGQES